MSNTEQFDYKKAIEELEAIAAKVENPQTGIEEIDKYMKRSQELIAQCRDYLRTARTVILSDVGGIL
ncbi:MAG: exodeoxyribonuclease VII small subunit [Bacteroidales bacterium]|nr:exodeoxyribonuclease VII small subunit [Bacteroidales bacterium]